MLPGQPDAQGVAAQLQQLSDLYAGRDKSRRGKDQWRAGSGCRLLTGLNTAHRPARKNAHMVCAMIPILWLLGVCAAISAHAIECVPVLVYHRFDAVAGGGTTVSTGTFASQLQEIRGRGYAPIPAHALVDYLLGKGDPLPPRPVVLSIDDGHRSVYTTLFPIVLRERLPVTLFIYPSAISRASYALTWDQLRAMRRSGLIDVQSHTYWHPNYHIERARLSPAAYRRFVQWQLAESRRVLTQQLGAEVDLLAWPFGIVDDELTQLAREAGYVAAFTIERRPVSSRETLLALPRYMVSESDRGTRFARLLACGDSDAH